MTIRLQLAAALSMFSIATSLHAQVPWHGVGGEVEDVAGNDTLQLRYLSSAPITQMRSDLDYGLLISDRRAFPTIGWRPEVGYRSGYHQSVAVQRISSDPASAERFAFSAQRTAIKLTEVNHG